MVKVTTPELTGGPSTRSSRSARSAAKDALNIPIMFDMPRTRQKTRAAAALHAEAVAAVQAGRAILCHGSHFDWKMGEHFPAEENHWKNQRILLQKPGKVRETCHWEKVGTMEIRL